MTNVVKLSDDAIESLIHAINHLNQLNVVDVEAKDEDNKLTVIVTEDRDGEVMNWQYVISYEPE